MMNGKILLLLAVGYVGGILFICRGWTHVVQTRALAAEGKRTAATVADQKSWRVYKNKRAHQLVVDFQTESGQRVLKEVMVPQAVFDSSVKGGSVGVVYWPKDPAVLAVADRVQVEYGQFAMGWGLLGIGVLFTVLVIKFPSFRRVGPVTDEELKDAARAEAAKRAQAIVKTMAPLAASEHVYEKVDAQRFPHLDLAFYDAQQRFLESRGFAFLADLEDATLRSGPNNPNVFLRTMLSGDGSIMADMYHLKPSLLFRALGAKEAKAVDFESRFSNGCFVCTSNSEEAGQLSQPAEVDSLSMSRSTPPDRVLEAHERRMAEFAARTGARPAAVSGLDGVLQAQRELQRLKAEHRRQTGLSKEELARLGGFKKDSLEIDLLHEEVQKELRRVLAGQRADGAAMS